jgi:hypothetical protein
LIRETSLIVAEETGQPQQAPPQQPPPVAAALLAAVAALPARPVSPTVGNRRTVSSWPCGHGAGSPERAIGRLTSNVVPHARHLTSYLGTVPSLVPGAGRPARAIVRSAPDT